MSVGAQESQRHWTLPHPGCRWVSAAELGRWELTKLKPLQEYCIPLIALLIVLETLTPFRLKMFGSFDQEVEDRAGEMLSG